MIIKYNDSPYNIIVGARTNGFEVDYTAVDKIIDKIYVKTVQYDPNTSVSINYTINIMDEGTFKLPVGP